MDYSKPTGLLLLFITFEVLAIASVLLRFISRRKTRVGFRADDWLALCALLPGTGLFIVEIYGIIVKVYGNLRSCWLRPPLDCPEIDLRLEFAQLLLNITAVTLIKLSTVLLYRRLFLVVRWFRFVSIIWIIFLIIWGIAFVVWEIFQCGSHVSAVIYGSPNDWAMYCQHSVTPYLVMLATDLATDTITLLLPLPMIVRLQMPLSRKIGIAIIFAMGAFTVVASATRTAMDVYLLHQTIRTFEESLTHAVKVSVWTYLEPMVGLCATCAVTFPPVFKDLKIKTRILPILSLYEKLPFSNRQRTANLRANESCIGSHDVEIKLSSIARTGSMSFDFESSSCDMRVEPANSQPDMTAEGSSTVSTLTDDDREIDHAEKSRNLYLS